MYQAELVRVLVPGRGGGREGAGPRAHTCSDLCRRLGLVSSHQKLCVPRSLPPPRVQLASSVAFVVVLLVVLVSVSVLVSVFFFTSVFVFVC